jgi:hypothetical protein
MSRKNTKKPIPAAGFDFAKAAPDTSLGRAGIVDTIRTNFLYVHVHGGYSLGGLSDRFNQIVPNFGWNVSSVRRFLDDRVATKEGSRVTLSNISPKILTAFLRTSVSMRDDVHQSLQEAEKMIATSEARWGKSRPQRDPVVEAIRENVKYLYDHGGYTQLALAKILNEGLLGYHWDKSAVRRFISAESRSEKSSQAEVNIPKASAEDLNRCLALTIQQCERVVINLRRASQAQAQRKDPSLD